MQLGFILSLVFAIVVTVFAIQNADSVLINFLFAEVEVSQALVIFISAALGAIIVTILGIIRQFKFKLKIKELNKKIKNLEEEKDIFEKRIEEISGCELKVENETINIENEIIDNQKQDEDNDTFSENTKEINNK